MNNLEEPCVVATGLIQTLFWQERKVKFIAKAESGMLEAVLMRVVPLIGADIFFTKQDSPTPEFELATAK